MQALKLVKDFNMFPRISVGFLCFEEKMGILHSGAYGQ